MAGFVFPEWTERFKPLLGLLLLGGPVYAITLVYFSESPASIRTGYRPAQPVPYSHALHAGRLGIDCRYCHDTVDKAARAAIPSAHTCMNCHTAILPNSELLAPIRAAVDVTVDRRAQFEWAKQQLQWLVPDSVAAAVASRWKTLRWVRVHDLPDYVYFNHSAHVTRGVGCESCHGRVDKMVEVYQFAPLTMSWCLDCHRAPERHLREPELTTVMGYEPPGGDRLKHGRALRDQNQIDPPTNCSTCHR